jgi:hypothetical protein
MKFVFLGVIMSAQFRKAVEEYISEQLANEIKDDIDLEGQEKWDFHKLVWEGAWRKLTPDNKKYAKGAILNGGLLRASLRAGGVE